MIHVVGYICEIRISLRVREKSMFIIVCKKMEKNGDSAS
jgi:hypothetical protein